MAGFLFKEHNMSSIGMCAKTKTTTGSDKWWEEQDCGKKCCICIPCKKWVESHPMESPRISWAKVNEITMALSLILTKFGLDGYQYNECCNNLRCRIQENFEFMNYNYCPMLGHGVNWVKLREEVSATGYRTIETRSGLNLDRLGGG